MHFPTLLPTFFCAIILGTTKVSGSTSYANDFVDPDYILAGGFGENTEGARETIAQWANELAAYGPWSACPCSKFLLNVTEPCARCDE